ncbi:MAG TPA: hypothetical protein VMG58_02110, partial [Candidatus Sulfotelmatobacter sp.]|nr:hypothetical protein [Candidatus Sulfotelmatobacter sp.]
SSVAELQARPEWSAAMAPIPGGIRLTVVAKRTEDDSTVARIRALGFVGLLADTPEPDLVALAKGETNPRSATPSSIVPQAQGGPAPSTAEPVFPSGTVGGMTIPARPTVEPGAGTTPMK